MVNLIGMKKEELAALIKDNAVNGEYVVKGITLKLRDDGDGVDIEYGTAKGFLIGADRDVSELYLHNSQSLKLALDVYEDSRHIAEVFGVDLVKKELRAPVFDQRDVTIARLEGKLAVFQSLAPSTHKVTFESVPKNEVVDGQATYRTTE